MDADQLGSLMARYQQSDTSAASALITALSPQIFHFFLSQVRDRSQAEDLLQDLWLRIHKARHTYRPEEPVLPWIYAIARRTRVDQFRKRRQIAEHESPGERLPEMAAPEAPRSARPDIAELLSTLPAAQREVILMLKVSGLSLEEVARATGTSVGSVKQKAHRGYEKLRRLLSGGQ
ncbi:MAG: RNA polymerase sigma factor [Acidobacteriota bacterium]|nr:RNA polymerase sigma factor [Acidobacteriota bacterium]